MTQRVEPAATTSRHAEPEEWRRFEQSIAEIFTGFGSQIVEGPIGFFSGETDDPGLQRELLDEAQRRSPWT